VYLPLMRQGTTIDSSRYPFFLSSHSKKTGDKPLSVDYISEWREFVTQYPYGNIFDWLQFIGAENKQGNITAYECNDIIRKLSLKVSKVVTRYSSCGCLNISAMKGTNC